MGWPAVSSSRARTDAAAPSSVASHTATKPSGRGAIAGQLLQEAEQRAVVAFEKLAEGVEFAVADGKHQVMIAGFHGAVTKASIRGRAVGSR